MSDLERDVVRILRVFGPCSNADVARRLGLPTGRTYRTIYRLTAAGLAQHPRKQQWDITERGCRHFEDAPNQQPALFTEDHP